MAEPDPRLLKAVRARDEERQGRLKAEQRERGLRMALAAARRRLAVATQTGGQGRRIGLRENPDLLVRSATSVGLSKTGSATCTVLPHEELTNPRRPANGPSITSTWQPLGMTVNASSLGATGGQRAVRSKKSSSLIGVGWSRSPRKPSDPGSLRICCQRSWPRLRWRKK